MKFPSQPTRPDLRSMLALFPPADFTKYDLVPGHEVPRPYRDLLVHEHHMTVTVEFHHGDLVDVRVLAWRLDEEAYARKILLALHGSGRVVQFGIMRVHFRYCSPEVSDEIVCGK